MEIRTATMNDLDAVAAVEAECFPVAEAATKRNSPSESNITATTSG